MGTPEPRSRAGCTRRRALALLVLCGPGVWLGVSCRSSSLRGGVADWPRPQAGAVVCEHPLATQVGLDILEKGGNAADAAVATALALAVVYPQAGNLGGGGFALWVDHEGEAKALDFRETAPERLTPEMYLDADGEFVPERSRWGPLSVGVPGTPAGLYELWRECGSGNLTFGQLANPAVRLAAEGFQVDAWLAWTLAQDHNREVLSRSLDAKALFYPGGEPLAEGRRLVQPHLARTIQRFAHEGPDGFYTGFVADSIVATLRSAPYPGRGRVLSPMNRSDLERYAPRWRPPLRGWFRGDEVISMPPPSSGGVALLQTLAMLEGLPAGTAFEEDEDVRRGAETAHRWIESMRRAFADRAEHLGDPDQYDVPLDRLLSPQWIAERRISIGPRADPEIRPLVAAPPAESSETTHLSVLDEDGNACSLTTTLNSSFGSGIYVTGAGFLLNNELDDFSVRAGVPNLYGLVGSEANQLAPLKRPLSSMTPTIVRDGGRTVKLVLGAPGGPRIITAVTQVVLRTLAFGQDLEQAVRAPRLHQQWRPVQTRFEGAIEGLHEGFAPELLDALEKDHAQPLEVQDARFGSVQAIWVDVGGVPTAVSDPRRGGSGGVEGEDAAAPAPPPAR